MLKDHLIGIVERLEKDPYKIPECFYWTRDIDDPDGMDCDECRSWFPRKGSDCPWVRYTASELIPVLKRAIKFHGESNKINQ